MIRSYFKLALRNMMKDKFYTFINIIGLTVGITAALFVVLYIQNEFSFDKFHHDSEDIYHIALTGRISGQEINSSTSSPPVGRAMVSTLPGVYDYLRIQSTGRPVLRYEELAFAEEKVYYVDSNFFNFFDFELIKGDPSQVLMEPNNIVLGEDLALKYFGDEDPIGNIILVGNDKVAYKITGIAARPPGNSHIQFNALLSISSRYNDQPEFFESWLSNSLQTYIRKNSQTSVSEVNDKLDELVGEHAGPILAQVFGVDFDEFKKNGGAYGYWIYPMTDIRLFSKLDHYYEPVGNITYIWIFGIVGLFVILIACINFMNLSTAKSGGRAREVGMRKTFGSDRSQMVFQFLLESFFYCVLATGLAFLAVYLLLPNFNQLAGVELNLDSMLTIEFLGFLIFWVLLVSVLAGSYPAFYLTRFKIVDVLKGSGISSMKSGKARSGLVVFQFMISMGLIICTGIVYQQIRHIQKKDLGLDKEHVIVVNHASRLGNDRQAFKNALDELPGVIGTSYSNNRFPGVNNTTIYREAGKEQDYILASYYADWDHLNAMGFELSEGRFFNRDFPSDSLAVVINRAAAEHLDLKNPTEEQIIGYNSQDPTRLNIIGVVEDFNFESLKDKVRPMVIHLTDIGNVFYVRYNTEPERIVEILSEEWQQISNGEPLEYAFLDEEFDRLFRAEQRLGVLFTTLSALAIFISCMGLFGLAAFMAEQRVKEIGIRKAMGASRSGLMRLLSVEFMKLLGISFLLAVVPVWFLMDNWLQEFAYRIDIDWKIFVVAGLISLIIAWLTVSYQAFKAASANPVDSLRNE